MAYIRKEGHPLDLVCSIFIEIEISILMVTNESWNFIQLDRSLIIESYLEYNKFDNG